MEAVSCIRTSRQDAFSRRLDEKQLCKELLRLFARSNSFFDQAGSRTVAEPDQTLRKWCLFVDERPPNLQLAL